MMMDQAQIDAFMAMALGYALAGFAAALYHSIMQRPAGFELLRLEGLTRMAAIPLLAITGPAIIMRNTIRGRRYERRKVHFVAMATAIAGLWSILLGVQALAALRSLLG